MYNWIFNRVCIGMCISMRTEEEIENKIEEIEYSILFHDKTSRPYECLNLGLKYLKWVINDV